MRSTPWLAGVTTFDGGDAAAAVKTRSGSERRRIRAVDRLLPANGPDGRQACRGEATAWIWHSTADHQPQDPDRQWGKAFFDWLTTHSPGSSMRSSIGLNSLLDG